MSFTAFQDHIHLRMLQFGDRLPLMPNTPCVFGTYSNKYPAAVAIYSFRCRAKECEKICGEYKQKEDSGI
jgi:hypothetical protein